MIGTIRLGERTKKPNHCDMYWRWCDVMKLALVREQVPFGRVVHHHGNWVKGDMPPNMIMCGFLNGRNPIHMYVRIGVTRPFYFRADTFERCVAVSVLAIQQMKIDHEDISNSLPMRGGAFDSYSIEIEDDKPVLYFG